MVSVNSNRGKISTEATQIFINVFFKLYIVVTYIEIVTVHSAANTSFLLRWELLLGELEH